MIDYDCTRKCKLPDHSNAINSAITKRSISETFVIRYITKLCRGFSEISDDLGRTALHIAASTNKYKIAEYLLKQGKINLLQKDNEGLTALHRAIFYGNIGLIVLLKRSGASLDVLDENFLNPLQYCCSQSSTAASSKKEILVLGKNKNYTLGNTINKDFADNVEYFRRNNITVKEASTNFYHSLFLSDEGVLYVCGHGVGGRLGTGNEATLVEPKSVPIKFIFKNERIVSISAGKNHSLVATNRDVVYSAGLNQHLQLGFKIQPEKMLGFKEITSYEQFSGRHITRVIAQDFHSIVINKNSLWVFGLNVGQFGTIQESIIVAKQLFLPYSENSKLMIVESSNAAICCYTHHKDNKVNIFYIFHNRKIKHYKNPLMEDFLKISVHGGELLYNSDEISKINNKPLKIIILTVAKNIYIWYEDQQFVKCIISSNFSIEVEKILWSSEKLIFLLDGNIYLGQLKHKIANNKNLEGSNEYKETYLKKELSKDFVTKINLKRISNITRAYDVCVDSDGENLIALVENSRKYLKPPDYEPEAYDFSELLYEDSLMGNSLDVIFVLNHVEYNAHRFIVCSRCTYLKSLIEKTNTKEIFLNVEDLTNPMLSCILKFIYTNEIDLNDLGLRNVDFSDPKTRSTLSKFSKVLEAMDYTEMKLAIDQIRQNESPDYDPPTFNWFDQNTFPEFYDLTLQFNNDQEISVHKCVLISRLEYFRMMFLHSWAEKNFIHLQNIPIEYFRPIINFAYTNDLQVFKDEKYSETYMFNMISICDQFLINNVKNIFELLICAKIYIRNCGEILDFAFRYNCEVLKVVCMKFICNNLSRVVESTTLDTLESEILNEITKFYRNYFDLDSYRVITPDSEAITDEDLTEFIKDFEIDGGQVEDEKPSNESKKNKGKSKHTPNKIETDKRNYEREARVLLKNLSFDGNEEFKETKVRKSESEDFDEKSGSSKRDNWKKVPAKKEEKDKKKIPIPAVRANEIFKTETCKSPQENFVSLNKLLNSPVIDSDSNNNSVTEELHSLRNSFTLADFTPTNMKHSKIRKPRRLSEQEPAAKIPIPEKEEVKPQVGSVWKMENIINNHQPIDLSTSFTIPKTPSKPTKLKSPKVITPTTSSSASSAFSVILKDELKERQHYEKNKSKSLILTQMEEAAIEELKAFYNVSMIFDEDITIQRKNQNTSKFNFATWQNQQKEKSSAG